MDSISGAFGMISSKYKIELNVTFDDMEDHSEQELTDIFRKNLELVLRSSLKETRKRRNIAIRLTVTGALFFAVMMLVDRLWESDSVWKDIFLISAISPRRWPSGRLSRYWWWSSRKNAPI